MFGRTNDRSRQAQSDVTYIVREPGKQGNMDRQRETRSYSVLDGIDGDGTILIGKGTRIVGEISNCKKVEVQGELEGTLTAESVTVSEDGVIAGTIRADEAEVHGVVTGEMEVAGLLDVQSTGRVDGNLAYGQIAIAAGGEVSGNILGPKRVLAEQQPAALPNGQVTDQSYGS